MENQCDTETPSPASAGLGWPPVVSECGPCGPQKSNRQLGLFTAPDSDMTDYDLIPTSASPETSRLLTSSPEDSLAKTSALRGSGEDSPTATAPQPVAAFSLNSYAFWKSLGLGGSFLRTSLVCYRTIPAEQWELYSVRWLNAGTASRGGFSTLPLSEWINPGVESSLSATLQEARSVPRRFFFSDRAVRGMRRRAIARNNSPIALLHTSQKVEPTRAWINSSSMTIRRLTPIEAERLQGYPDHWTCVTHGTTAGDFTPSVIPLPSPLSSGSCGESN